LDEEEPDRPAADNGHRVAHPDLSQVEGVDGDAERLQEGALGVGNAVGKDVDLMLGPGHPLPEPAVSAGVPREGERQAEVFAASPARPAGPARDGRVDGDALTHPRARRDHARELMAQHQLDRLVVVEEGDRLVEIMSDADLRKDEGPERRPTADGQFGGGLSTGGNPPLWIVRDGAGPAAWDVTGDGRSGGPAGCRS